MRLGDVRFVFRHLPVGGAASVRAAQAAECAHEQDRFWEYVEALFQFEVGEGQGTFTDATLLGYARSLELNAASFSSCLQSGRYDETILRDTRDAEALGVRAVPTLFINGQRFDGLYPYEEYVRVIEEQLAASR